MEPKFVKPSDTTEAEQPKTDRKVQPEPTAPATPSPAAEQPKAERKVQPEPTAPATPSPAAEQPSSDGKVQPEPTAPATPTPEVEQIKKKEVKVEPPTPTPTTPSLEAQQPQADIKVQPQATAPATPSPKAQEYDLQVKAEQVEPSTKPFTQTPSLEATIEAEASESIPSAEASYDQWRGYGQQVAAFVERLPNYAGNFFGEYKRPLTVIGVILGSIIALKVLSGFLDTINEIPFLEPTFQLIGIIYTGWFVYRYLLSAGSRQELLKELDTYKEQILGDKNSDSQ